ncbi:hypothetical protein QTN47_26195 [Danxiaibacter flavus]|uniref:FimB/Mfa2 family fimbrial subunit n=1 Tax=Danxiaibacter flavus TaxID=3049108 RepID=A0ABV3ZMI4_9BACT|nr:hypothetical protein QNM32_26195 [Chitinophagaceae bacterium DXS]
MSGLSYIKKILCACLCVVAVACNKSSTAPNENDKPDKTANTSAAIRKYAVRFSLGDIDVSDGRTANREMPVRNYLHYLSYRAYDSTGRLISKIVQDSILAYAGPDFGVINDSLPVGDYTIVVVGAQYYSVEFYDDTLLSRFNLFTRHEDVCLKKFNITVSEHDSIAAPIKLERITGVLEINLKDTLHPEVKMEKVYVDSTYLHMQIATGELQSSITDFFPSWGSLAYPYSFSIGYLGSNTTHTVTIVGCDINEQPVAQRVITGVYIYPNRKTILTGRLFDTSDTGGKNAGSLWVDKRTGSINQKF